MSPEKLGSNMWWLLEGEYFLDNNMEKVRGPLVVRVHEFPQIGKLGIQCGNTYTEVDGKTFEGVVQKEK